MIVENFEEFENIDEEIEKYESIHRENQRKKEFQNKLIAQYNATGKVGIH